VSDADTDLKRQRGNFDLLLRAQRLGRTGYIISDATTDRVYWSDSLFEQRKLPRRPYFTIEEGRKVIHPDDLPEFVRKREQSISDGKEFEHEMRIICGDGSLLWERGNSQPQFDAQGKFIGLLSVVDDITEERNAAATLLEQEATYRALFNSIGDAIFLSANGAFVDCNDAAMRTFGATREQLIAHSPIEYSPPFQPDGRPSLEAAREKIAAALAGRRQVFEWRHCRVDGTEFDAEVVLSRVEGSADSSYFFGVVRDITDRKQAEVALRASHDKFAGAFSSTTDAMIVMRMGEEAGEGVFLDANSAASEMFGLARRQLVGKTAREANLLVSELSLQKFRGEMLAQGMVHGFRTNTRHSDGTTRRVEINASLFGRPDDRLAILVVRDITEQEAAAHKIGELNSSLETSNHQLRAITDNLPVGVSQTGLDGRVLFLNKTLAQWLAVDAERARGLTAPELFSKDYIDATRPMREAFAAGARTVEHTLQLPDGTTRTVEATNIPDLDAAGVQQSNFGFIVDVSERKRAEDELRASHAKFESAFEYSADAVLVSTIGSALGEGTLVEMNRSAEELFGRPRGEIVGRKFADLLRNTGIFPLGETRRRITGDGSYRDVPIETRRPDGSVRHLLASGARFDLGGQPYSLTVLRDVTQAREAETRIRELNASLEKSVGQLQAIANNLPVAISYHDAERRFLFLNRTMEQWFNVTSDQIIGKTVDGFVSDEYRERQAPVRERFGQGEYRYEAALPYPDGHTRTVDVSFVPELDEAGNRAGFYTLAIDITGRKQAEAELKASHEKFSSAFENSTDAMIVSTVGERLWEGVILELNRAAERMFEQPRQDFIGKPMSAFRDRMNMFDLGQYREAITADGTVRGLALTIPRNDGTALNVLISGSRFDIGGKPHTLTVIRDVSEARAAERKIHDLNTSLEVNVRLLRAVADNLPVAIGYQDKENRFVFVNRTLEQWFASTRAEMLGQTVHPFVSEAYFAAVEPVRQALAAGKSTVQVTLPFPDGKTRTVDSTMILDRDENGEVRGRYSLLIDVTERKAEEEQLLQSQKMQAIGKLTGGVAHDFNNLLAVISGNLDLAAERGGDERIAKLLEPARRAAERGSTLTKSLLAFSRQQPLSPQVADLNTLSRDMTELLRRTLPSNIGIEFVGAAGLWKSEVDPGQLQNALLNLVVNARDAMPDGGRLTIETQNARIDTDYAAAHDDLAPGQYVMLAVSDTGMGMPAEVIARAFEPFYTTKGVGEGTGLGLSMVYGFAKQSGGHVAIYSEVGNGTTVKVYLPRWKGQAVPETVRAAAVIPPANSETVLVVEDDPDMRLIAVTMLRSLGYKVLEAPSGTKALKVLGDEPGVALLLSDVVLAGSMNGRRLAEEARNLHPQLKVLFMSGYTEDAIVHHGRLDEGVNFIQKPFRKQDLAIKAREALDGTPR
jgi:PAS domain S-box-containing protein